MYNDFLGGIAREYSDVSIVYFGYSESRFYTSLQQYSSVKCYLVEINYLKILKSSIEILSRVDLSSKS